MGPPEFTGGNMTERERLWAMDVYASMGPPEFTGGNHWPKIEAALAMLPLQWGRRNSPAETWRSRWTASSWRQGFNGAAGIHRRKLIAKPYHTTGVSVLQWGRRNSPAETLLKLNLVVNLQYASMGPPEFTGGNTTPAGRSRCSLTRFNGAAGIHRRKRPKMILRGGLHGIASMGPPEFTGGNSQRSRSRSGRERWLQWGRRNSPAETSGSPPPRQLVARCFNGAAGIHRRKLVVEIHVGGQMLCASMGPPEFTGGNTSFLAECVPWKVALQWGRRNSPAETVGEPESPTAERTASMGPPEFTGGNLWIVEESRMRAVGRLQWGRRNSPAETSWR